METRSALRWTAKTRGAGARSPEIAAEVAEAAASMVASVFSGARRVSIEIGCGVGATRSGAGSAGASGADGVLVQSEPLVVLLWLRVSGGRDAHPRRESIDRLAQHPGGKSRRP